MTCNTVLVCCAFVARLVRSCECW